LCFSFDAVRAQPLEFVRGAAALPADAPISLARVAQELQRVPTLKLHIAGHLSADEDPKLSSQRAQAVGAALIALGAAPSQLRAKGYSASTAGLSAGPSARLEAGSERRVGLHGISEVRTAYPLEFGAGRSELSGACLQIELRTLAAAALAAADAHVPCSILRRCSAGATPRTGSSPTQPASRSPASTARMRTARRRWTCSARRSVPGTPTRAPGYCY